MTVNGETKTLSKDDVILIPSSCKYVTKVVFKTLLFRRMISAVAMQQQYVFC